jgi:hypothetical protein
MNAGRWIALVLLAAAVAAVALLAPDSGGRSAAAVSGARDLAGDQAAGGHTLDRHVGRSDAELRRRLAEEPGISAASSFADRAIAERVVAATLDRERRRIERWLQRGGGNLALDYRGAPGEVVGRTLARGDREARATGEARVVLRRSGGSFFVLTAFPLEPGGRE